MGKKTATNTKPPKDNAPQVTDDPGATEPLSNFQDLKKTGRVDEGQQEGPPKEEPDQVFLPYEFLKLKIREKIFVDGDWIENVKHEKLNVVRNKCRKESSFPAHPDFLAAFADFRVHLLLLLGYADYEKIKVDEASEFDSPMLQYFSVTQVALGGNADGVTISGARQVHGKVANLNSPFTKFFEGEEKGYRFGNDLELAWSQLCEEARQYFFGGKYGEGAQAEINFDEQPYSEEAL